MSAKKSPKVPADQLTSGLPIVGVPDGSGTSDAAPPSTLPMAAPAPSRNGHCHVAGPSPSSARPRAQASASALRRASAVPARPVRPPQASRTSKAKKGAKAPAAKTPNTKGKVRRDKDVASSKKLSAVDAAARLLGETNKPMTCPELIEAMSKKGYWTSPGGKTPAATLYSAILRELQTKGKEARFQKTERGKFARA